VGGQEALAEKCSVGAVSVVAFAYDTYTTPSKNNGVLRATLTDFRWGRALLDTPHGFAMSHWNPIGKRLAIELTDPEGTNSTPDLSTSFQIENAISAGKIFYV